VSYEFVLNGDRTEVAAPPMTRLLDVLRRELGLTGTKEGCGEGECGACTVLLDGEPVASCLVPLLQCEGRRIDTIEGLAGGEAAALIEELVDRGGVQCGACTPGIVVAACALLRRTQAPTRTAVGRALAGNLCRCTGYAAIQRAIQAVGKP